MRRRYLRRTVTLVVVLALMSTGGAAVAQTQPTEVGNADGRSGGATTPGPHCHVVLPADGNRAFDQIISGAIHEAHVRTGLPEGTFQATDCP